MALPVELEREGPDTLDAGSDGARHDPARPELVVAGMLGATGPTSAFARRSNARLRRRVADPREAAATSG